MQLRPPRERGTDLGASDTWGRASIRAGKTIGAICIAPVILAIIFGKDVKPSLTIGTDAETAKDICSFGADHVECSVRDFNVDKKNKIVTTPAYMLGKGPAEVFTGIEKLVKAVLEMS